MDIIFLLLLQGHRLLAQSIQFVAQRRHELAPETGFQRPGGLRADIAAQRHGSVEFRHLVATSSAIGSFGSDNPIAAGSNGGARPAIQLRLSDGPLR